MTVRIVDATALEPAAWDELAVRSVRGEAFQSHAWAEGKRSTGWTPRRYRIEDDDGPVAVVSMQERELPVRVMGPMLYAPLGPVLLRDDETGRHAAMEGLRDICRRRRAALLVIDPNWDETEPVARSLPAAGFRKARHQVQVSSTGMFVPLLVTDEGQRSLVNENVTRNISRARKQGVQVERLDAATPVAEIDRGLAAGYEMLLETGLRRGFAAYLRPAEHHNAAQRALICSGAATLFVARHDGAEVAHTIVHHCGSRALLFQAGEREPGEPQTGQKRVAANFLLQWEIIRWAAGAGFLTYDMGGVDNHESVGLPKDESHPLWNLFRFKSQWGARPVQFCGAQEYAASRVRGGIVRAAWRASDVARRLRRGSAAGAS